MELSQAGSDDGGIAAITRTALGEPVTAEHVAPWHLRISDPSDITAINDRVEVEIRSLTPEPPSAKLKSAWGKSKVDGGRPMGSD